MEWTGFGSLFATRDRSSTATSIVHDDDPSEEFAAAGEEIVVPGGDDPMPGALKREPSGVLYTDENDLCDPQLSLVVSEDIEIPTMQDPSSPRSEIEEDYTNLIATSTINHTFSVQEEFPYLSEQASYRDGQRSLKTSAYHSEIETDWDPQGQVSATRSSLGGEADDRDLEQFELSMESLDSFQTQDESISSDEALEPPILLTPTLTRRDSSDELAPANKRVIDGDTHDNTSVLLTTNPLRFELNPSTEIKDEKRQHLRFFGHGKRWTLIAIIVSWVGVALSLSARYSFQFVTLNEPVLIDPFFESLDSIGILRIQVCYNETVARMSGCQTIPLAVELVQDNLFDVARLFLNLGALFGIFFSVVLSTSIYWESINLRPIGLGFLLSYFLQSFTMLFFDSDICNTNKCRPGAGCIYCIAASLCWITACVAAAKMNNVKTRNTRRRRRRSKRVAKKATKELTKKQLHRETSSATEQTVSISTSASDSSLPQVDVEQGGGFRRNNDGTYEC
jgi:hypothetical protein